MAHLVLYNAGRRDTPWVVLQLGLAFVGCITNVNGIQIWAEYAQSLPVPGITATDAYQLKINGAQLLGSQWLISACVCCNSRLNNPQCAGEGTTGLFDYLHLTASQVGYQPSCIASLSVFTLMFASATKRIKTC